MKIRHWFHFLLTNYLAHSTGFKIPTRYPLYNGSCLHLLQRWRLWISSKSLLSWLTFPNSNAPIHILLIYYVCSFSFYACYLCCCLDTKKLRRSTCSKAFGPLGQHFLNCIVSISYEGLLIKMQIPGSHMRSTESKCLRGPSNPPFHWSDNVALVLFGYGLKALGWVLTSYSRS